MARPEIDFKLRGDPTYQRMVSMGNMLAGKDSALRPIKWPDMKAIAAATRVPMSEDTKERLRSLAADRPRNVGDEVARMLAPIEPGDRVALARLAVKFLECNESAEELCNRYAHLDNGRYRMTIGNRMRAKWKAQHLYVGRKDDGTKDTGDKTGAHAPAAGKAEAAAQSGASISEKARVVPGREAGRAVKAAATVKGPVVRHGSDRKRKRK